MTATQVVHLNIAELIISLEPVMISTILGSCISVCLFSPDKKIGGMIHYALPSRKYAHLSDKELSEDPDPLRFGDQAIERLVHEMCRATGLSSSRLRAKIVGGGAVVEQLKKGAQIGALNLAVAEEILKKLDIPILGREVGGTTGRKVVFYTDTGRLRVASLRDSNNQLVVKAPTLVTHVAALGKKRVFIVDDSKTIRQILTQVFNRDPSLEVVGTAESPLRLEEQVRKLKPDVITLDIHMPGMSGIEFLEKLYPKILIPVVIVTSISREESNTVFRALELGAVDYIQKPKLEDLNELSGQICEKVKSAASVKIKVRKSQRSRLPSVSPKLPLDPTALIVIGASTGGTEALKEVLTRLPKNIPPILIVQHIPPVFSAAFANRLNELCPFEVKEAENGDTVKPGRALIAPGGFHMRFQKSMRANHVTIDQESPVQRHRPSVDILFQSVARQWSGKTIAVILTGMGSDGAQGLSELRKKGARTIAQDEESCVVFGMPKEAIRLGGAEVVSNLFEIPEKMMKILEQKKTA